MNDKDIVIGCHDNDGWAQRFAPHTWRGPDTGHVYRSCSYCGCIHPDDLLFGLQQEGAQLSGADWKYGWPHKFYIDRLTLPSGVEITFGKWYNRHLLDLDEARFTALSELLFTFADITFEIHAEDERRLLFYRAPYAGYQRINNGKEPAL